MKTRDALLAALGSLIVGVLVGYTATPNLRPTEETPAQSKATLPPSYSEQAIAPEPFASKPGTWASKMSELSSMPEETIGRRMKVFDLLKSITAANWREAYPTVIQAVREQMLTSDEGNWCLERIGEVGKIDALRLLAEMESSNGWIAIRGWAADDPVGAAAYIDTIAVSQSLRIGFVVATAAKHPALARRVLEKVSPHFQAVVISEQLAGKRASESFVRDWLIANASNPGLPEKGDGSASQVFLKLAEGRGIGLQGTTPFTSWMEGFMGQPFADLDKIWWIPDTLHGTSKSNAAGDLDWLTRFSASRPGSAVRTFERFFERAPEQRLNSATGWLKANHEHAAYDQAAFGLTKNPSAFQRFSRSDLQAWAESIGDEKLREQAIGALTKVSAQ